jgi:hypothetical protein
MSIQNSEIFSIQSHEYGGQMWLYSYLILPNNNLHAQSNSKNSISEAYNINSFDIERWKTRLFYLKQVPSTQTSFIKYYILCWSKDLDRIVDESGRITEPTHIIEKNQDGIVISQYDSTKTYDTSWSIIKIPSLLNASNVYLFKINKTNDADNGKFLYLDFNTEVIGGLFGLSLTDTISSRAQLWNIIPLR